MGQSKGLMNVAKGLSPVYAASTERRSSNGGAAGYDKATTLTPQQSAAQNEVLAMIAPYLQQAAQGYQDFLPGGKGTQALTEQAQRNFKQSTVPQIMNSFGSGAKGSSALNQALAAGAADLNSNIAAQQAQYQLAAAQGLGSIGSTASQQLNNPSFSYVKKAPSIWERITGAGTGAIGGAAQGYATTGSPYGAAAGAVAGGARGWGG
jgi:hypothetical protein